MIKTDALYDKIKVIAFPALFTVVVFLSGRLLRDFDETKLKLESVEDKVDRIILIQTESKGIIEGKFKEFDLRLGVQDNTLVDHTKKIQKFEEYFYKTSNQP